MVLQESVTDCYCQALAHEEQRHVQVSVHTLVTCSTRAGMDAQLFSIHEVRLFQTQCSLSWVMHVACHKQVRRFHFRKIGIHNNQEETSVPPSTLSKCTKSLIFYQCCLSASGIWDSPSLQNMTHIYKRLISKLDYHHTLILLELQQGIDFCVFQAPWYNFQVPWYMLFNREFWGGFCQFLFMFSLIHYFLLHYSQVISLFLYLLCCKVVILSSIQSVV